MANTSFTLAMPAASPTQSGLRGFSISPDPHYTRYPFHFSHWAPGGTADCLCLPRGTEGSSTPIPRSRGREPSWPVGGGCGGGGVPQAGLA